MSCLLAEGYNFSVYCSCSAVAALISYYLSNLRSDILTIIRRYLLGDLFTLVHHGRRATAVRGFW